MNCREHETEEPNIECHMPAEMDDGNVRRGIVQGENVRGEYVPGEMSYTLVADANASRVILLTKSRSQPDIMSSLHIEK